jgi:hypothetical protein
MDINLGPVHISTGGNAEDPTPLPQRGDAFEQWLKAQRDEWHPQDRQWQLLDDVLDEYRLHADTRTPLDQHACDHCCDCREAGESK